MTRTIFLMLLIVFVALSAFAANSTTPTATVPAATPAVAPPAVLSMLPPPADPWECCCAPGCPTSSYDNCCYHSESCCKKGGAMLERLAAVATGKPACAGKVEVFQFGTEPKRSVVFKQ